MSAWRTEAPYDIVGLDYESPESGDTQWSIYRIEVKASSQAARMDFPISESELNEAKYDGPSYVIWRIRGVCLNKKPTWFRLPDPHSLIENEILEIRGAISILAPAVTIIDEK